jgi:cytochrome c biogenesis protein CcdA
MPDPSPETPTPPLGSFERRVMRGFAVVVTFCLLGAVVVLGLSTHAFREWIAVVAGVVVAFVGLMAAQGWRPVSGWPDHASLERAPLGLALVAGALGGLVTGLILPGRPVAWTALIGALGMVGVVFRERMDAYLFRSSDS